MRYVQCTLVSTFGKYLSSNTLSKSYYGKFTVSCVRLLVFTEQTINFRELRVVSPIYVNIFLVSLNCDVVKFQLELCAVMVIHIRFVCLHYLELR